MLRNNVMHKKISYFILFTLLINIIFPLFDIIKVFAVSPDKTTYEGYITGGAGGYPTYDEIKNTYNLGVPQKTDKGYFNCEMFIDLNLVVYGSPYGDFKEVPNGYFIKNGKRGEYRYLGYSQNGQPFTNANFPADTVNNNSNLNNKNWVYMPWKNGLTNDSYQNFYNTIQNQTLLAQSIMNFKTSGRREGDNAVRDTGISVSDILNYGVVLDMPSLVSAGSFRMWHTTSSGKTYYITFNGILEKKNYPNVEGKIFLQDGNTYTLKSDEDKITIPVTVKGILKDAQYYGDPVYEMLYYNRKDINSYTLELSNVSDGKILKTSKPSNSYKVVGDGVEVEHTFELTLYRDNLSEGENTINLASRVTAHFLNQDKVDLSSKSVNITVEVEPLTTNAYVTSNVSSDPSTVKFNDSDIPVTVSVSAEVKNLSNPDNIDRWVFKAFKESDMANVLEKTFYIKTLQSNAEFNFTIPKSKITTDDYTENFYTEVKVILADGTELSIINKCSTYVYKTNPPEPEPIPNPEPENESPVAIITAPSSVKAGDKVYVSGSKSYDTDGYISTYMWTTPSANGTITGSNGTIWYSSTGSKTIGLGVADDLGATDTTSKTIYVLEPTPDARIILSGTLKENRKIIADATSSKSPYYYPINWTLTDWEITPVSGGSINDIKYLGSLDGKSKIEFLIGKAGKYNLKLTVTNTAGYSDTVTVPFEVEPDLPPIADFSMVTKIFRDFENYNNATIKIKDTSYSEDGDTIKKRVWVYAYDSDNDGDFSDESAHIIDDTNLEEVEIKVKDVGKYLIRLSVIEDFGQPTIPDFITIDDYKSDDTIDKPLSESVVEVLNLAPVVDLQLREKRKVDIFIDIRDTVHNDVNLIQSKVNSIIKSRLGLEGYDVNVNIVKNENLGQQYSIFTSDKTMKLYDVKNKKIIKDVRENNYAYMKSIVTTNGIIYFNDNYSGFRVYKYDSYKDELTLLSDLYGYELKTVDNNNNLYLIKDYNKIYKYDTNTGALSYIYTHSKNIKNLVWSYGYLYIDDKSYLYKLDLSNYSKMQICITSLYAKLFQVNENKNIYFALDTNNASIIEVDYQYNNKNNVLNYFGGNFITMKENTIYYTTTYKPPYEYNPSGLYEYNTVTKEKKRLVDGEIKILGKTTDGKIYFGFKNNNYFKWYGKFKDIYYYNINTKSYTSVPNVYLDAYGEFSITPIEGVKKNSHELIDNIETVNWRDNSERYYVVLNDDILTELNDKEIYSKIAINFATNNVHLIGMGTNKNKGQFETLLNQNNYNGIFIDNTNIDNALNNLTDYIILNAEQRPNRIYQYVTTEQEIEYFTHYSDEEFDPIYSERWKFDHVDPNYFENGGEVFEYSGQYINTPFKTLSKIGKYEVIYQAKDNPKNDNRFDEYRLWSSESLTKLILYVHRKPVAQFTASIDSSNNLTISESSYDLDHYSEIDKGIVDKKWSWKSIDDNTWTAGMPPSTLLADKIYLIALQVKDKEGVWSERVIKTIETNTENVPPIAQFTLSPNPLKINQILIVNDASYDPKGDSITSRTWTVEKEGVGVVYTGSTCPTNYSSYGIGNYTITLTVSDGTFTSEPYSQKLTVIPSDETPPTVNINPASSNWRNSSLNINITASDSGTGIAFVRYKFTNDTIKPTDWITDNRSNFTVTLDEEGIWYLHVEAYDNAGNVTYQHKGQYKIDFMQPSVEIITNGSNVYAKSHSTIVNVTDELSGINTLQYAWSTEKTVPSSGFTNFTSGSIISTPSGQSADYYLHIKAKDIAGNENIITSNVFKLDNTPPAFIQASIKGERYFDGNTYWIKGGDVLKVKIMGYDEHSNIRYSYVRIPVGDNRSLHRWDVDNPTYNNEWMTSLYTDIVGAEESYDSGKYREVEWSIKGLNDVVSDIQYYFTDFADNKVGYGNTGYKIGVDTIPPTGSILINNGDMYTDSVNVTITLNASDNISNVTEVKISNDNKVWVLMPYNTTINWTLSNGDGIKTVYIKFKDKAGNWSTVYSDTIELDTAVINMTMNLNPAYPTGIPASETLDVTVETDCVKEVTQVQVWLEGESAITLTKQSTNGTKITWHGTYNIPSYKADKDYYNFYARAIKITGFSKMINDKVKVETPINLNVNDLPEFIIDTTVNLNATTSKYVNNLTVVLYENTVNETTINMTGNLVGNNKQWSISHYIDINIPEGDYTAEFIATTPNGKSETITKTYKVIGIKLENFRITTVYDIAWKDLFIDEFSNYTGYKIPQNQMPVQYYNTNPIKVGYQLDFEIDSKGLNEIGDKIEIDVEFLDVLGNTVTPKYKDNDNNILNLPIEYYSIGKATSKFSITKVSQTGNDATWEFSYYLPATTFVANEDDLVIKFTIIGKKGAGTTYNYNEKTGFNGKIFIYTLKQSALDDFYLQNGN